MVHVCNAVFGTGNTTGWGVAEVLWFDHVCNVVFGTGNTTGWGVAEVLWFDHVCNVIGTGNATGWGVAEVLWFMCVMCWDRQHDRGWVLLRYCGGSCLKCGDRDRQHDRGWGVAEVLWIMFVMW